MKTVLHYELLWRLCSCRLRESPMYSGLGLGHSRVNMMWMCS